MHGAQIPNGSASHVWRRAASPHPRCGCRTARRRTVPRPRLSRRHGRDVFDRPRAPLRAGHRTGRPRAPPDVVLAPMVNIVRVPQGGWNFRDARRIRRQAPSPPRASVARRDGDDQALRHEHQENARQSVSADVGDGRCRSSCLDSRRGAAGVASVMASQQGQRQGVGATPTSRRILRDRGTGRLRDVGLGRDAQHRAGDQRGARLSRCRAAATTEDSDALKPAI